MRSMTVLFLGILGIFLSRIINPLSVLSLGVIFSIISSFVVNGIWTMFFASDSMLPSHYVLSRVRRGGRAWLVNAVKSGVDALDMEKLASLLFVGKTVDSLMVLLL